MLVVKVQWNVESKLMVSIKLKSRKANLHHRIYGKQLIDINYARTVHLDGVKAPPPIHGGDSAPLQNKVIVNTPPPHHGGDSAPLSSNALSLLLSTVHLVVHSSPQCCHRLSDLDHPALPPHRSALVHHIGPGFPFPSVVTARLTLIIQRYRPIDLHSYITLVQAVDIFVHLHLPEWPAPATSSPSVLFCSVCFRFVLVASVLFVSVASVCLLPFVSGLSAVVACLLIPIPNIC